MEISDTTAFLILDIELEREHSFEGGGGKDRFMGPVFLLRIK